MRRPALILCAALLTAGAAWCGGSRHATGPSAGKLPRSLAQAWASRADAIAVAAAAGRGCQAQTLADSLRDDVVGADARVPAAYRSTLLVSVNQLADRIACAPPTKTVTAPAKPPPGPGHHDDHRKPPEHGPKEH